MKQAVLITLILMWVHGICPQSASAQVTIDFPRHAEQEVVLFLKQGTQNDTIFQGVLDEKGQVTIPIPTTHRDYRGIAGLKPQLSGAYFEFIVAGENMTLRCEEEYPHGNNVTFEHSPENESLQTWFIEQSIRQQKIGLLTQLQQVFEEEEKRNGLSGDSLGSILYSPAALIQEQADFEVMLQESPLYAARFIEFHNLMNQQIASLLFADSTQKADARTYVRERLDVNSLFTSGLWYDVLNGLLAIYDQRAPYHDNYIEDMTLLLKRANSDRIYTTLADNLFAICEATGWTDLEIQLANFLINDGRIKEPAGRLKVLMERL